MSDSQETSFKITKDNKLTDLLGTVSWKSLLAAAVLILLLYLFFTDKIAQFYSSALFLFYGLTHRMWVSVIMLGVFQTLIMIPMRILRVKSSHHIKEFQKSVVAIEEIALQQKRVKRDFNLGNTTFLFYLVDFMIQFLTFISIGRLFLTDFYSNPLNSKLLYSFVPYPRYPILDTFFKIPYLTVTETRHFGGQAVLIFWAVLLVLQVIVWLISYFKNKNQQKKDFSVLSMPLSGKYGLAYIVATLIFAWFVMAHFPTDFALKIFSGDVSIPNRTLNTITAFATFATLLWFDYRDILRKTELAYEQGVSALAIKRTRSIMFRESIQSASLIGLGAYFITNHIPSAFELSIFTFELIAIFSPLTLDKLILKTMVKKPEAVAA